MNIGNFAASCGKKLILGNLTSLLGDRSICPSEPSRSGHNSKCESVEFHSLASCLGILFVDF